MAAPARMPFAARIHVGLVVVMITSFLLITQQVSKTVYQIGFGLLVASTLVQVVFGNIPPEAGFKQSARTLAIGLVIVATVFGIGAAITPMLVNLGGDGVPSIELREVTKVYGKRRVLSGLDLAVEPGTFLVVFGPPACGKSVAVRMLTGLERPTSGTILLRGRDASGQSSAERDVGYVPQSFALYPHYTVEENIAYPLDLMRMPRREIAPRVASVAERLRIQHLLHKFPGQLSGGEKQRVALARGIVKPTDLFVLDDPLVGLDFKLREQLFDDLKQMQRDLEATFVFMTSDPLEALALADEVAILDQGRILEQGKVEAVFRRPRHVSTLELLGAPASNRLPGRLLPGAGALRLDAGVFQTGVQLDAGAAPPADGQVEAGIRPQHLVLGGGGEGMLKLRAEAILREDLGAEEIVYLKAGALQLVTVVPHAARAEHPEGNITVRVLPGDVAIFSAETGLRLGQGAALHG